MISIIIPNYNQERFVSKAIQSALAQTCPAGEIIVIDDGSTDNSAKIVKSFGPHIRYFWQMNKGLAGARNTGIHLSHGDYIALLDADDEWYSNYLERMIGFADQNPDASVFYCQAQAIDPQGNILPQVFGGPALPFQDLYQTLLRANFIIPSTILMRRTAVMQVGLFDQNLRSCEDWDLWLRLLPTYKIVGMNDILVKYRIHGTSLSNDPVGMQSAQRSVVEKHFGLDDGNPELWSQDKRWAFGGLYRYHALTSIQRQGNWEMGARYLVQAFKADPSLSKELHLFYELTLGNQPAGYRGSDKNLGIKENATKVMNLLDAIFQADVDGLQLLKRQVYGTACYAIGLCAYNTRHLALSRQYFQLASKYRPELLYSSKLLANWLKSWLGNRLLGKLRRPKLV